MNRSRLRGLIALNAALLVALAAVTFMPVAGAQQGARGNYTMVSGRLQGVSESAIYFVDTNSMQMVATYWNSSRRTLDGIGYRDMAADASRGQVRPR